MDERPLPPGAAGEAVPMAHELLNCFTCRTRRQGSRPTWPAWLAVELLHLPDEPAGVELWVPE